MKMFVCPVCNKELGLYQNRLFSLRTNGTKTVSKIVREDEPFIYCEKCYWDYEGDTESFLRAYPECLKEAVE